MFIDFIEEYGFTQKVDSPTRGNNILDVFLTNRPSMVKSCSTVPDHEAVTIINSQAPQLKVREPSIFATRQI